MFDKLFFIIYHAYYKKGNYTNDIPPVTVGGIFVVFFYCIYLNGVTIYQALLEIPYIKNTKIQSLFIVLLFSFLVYACFFWRSRYKKIYIDNLDSQFLISKRAKIIGFSIVIFGILSPFITAIITNKLFKGYWV